MNKETNYYSDARRDAADTAREFLDQIVEQLKDAGAASDDLHNDYPDGDSYHHENHVDKAYSLSEAAALLEQLDEFEETDNGLWDGLQPREAISAQAAYTYGNAVLHFWAEIIRAVNDNEWIQGPLLQDAVAEERPDIDELLSNAVLATIKEWL